MGPRLSAPAEGPHHASRHLDAPHHWIVDQYSVVSDGWKLVRNVHRPEGMSEFELYNHDDDPLNHGDVAAGHPEIVERLTVALAARLCYADARQLPTDEDAANGLTPEELERLRSLGYIR